MLLVNRLKDGFTSGITSSLSDSTPSRDCRGVSKGSVSISCLFGLHQWRFDNASHLEKLNTVRMDASSLPTAFLTSTGEFILKPLPYCVCRITDILIRSRDSEPGGSEIYFSEEF